jgi:hypothetical protein
MSKHMDQAEPSLDQEQRREILSEWVKTIARDRHWLAERLAIKKSTVDSWFSNRRIPEAMWRAIESLMATTGSSPLEDLLNISLTLEEFEALEKARLFAGYESRAAFYRDAIISFTEKVLQPIAQQPRGIGYNELSIPLASVLVDSPD